MKILLLYDNFIRDYRGLLLLKALLKAKGHKVWIKASWNRATYFAKTMKIDVIVGGQVAEASTHYIGKFAKRNNIRFVLNSTENVTVPEKFEMFITYNTSELNDDIIDLQTVAARDVYDYILRHPKIKPDNKNKYKYLGFPRLDLTANASFKDIEINLFKSKYALQKKRKIYLFISSFLLEGAFTGIPQRDLDKWNYTEFKKRTDDLLVFTTDILKKLIAHILDEEDVLLIKKHPWDCSSYLNDTFNSSMCIVLDNNDYILPCIASADVILHTFSTSAIEAWMLNKKTISLMLNEYKASSTLNHMNNELTAASFEELKILLNNYPASNPSIKSLEIFAPNLDGRATIRLVEEIHRLKPYPRKLVNRKISMISFLKNLIRPAISILKALKIEVSECLYDKGYLKYNATKFAKPNTKIHDFYTWENNKAHVINLYNKPFKKYAKKYIKGNL